MRALHAAGLLDRVSVVSAVSGGSVIAAMWAYSNDPFPDFETRVRALLRRGLTIEIFRALFNPRQACLWLATLCIAHPVNCAVLALRVVFNIASTPLTWIGISNRWTERVQPPFCRWASRSTAFVEALRGRCFGSLTLSSTRRNNIDVVINACDLRTGTAFRFGTQSTGSWVAGRMEPQRADLATAVAASAAFPLLLPALDLRLFLKQSDGKELRERVILTDGGVFDNLGTSVFEPGRDAGISTNAFAVDYILCSSAGQGRPEERALPYWLFPRLVGSTLVMFRKLQDAGLAALHAYRKAGDIKGFALSYLAQSDSRLENSPANLVSRNSVIRYPTNFSAMSEADCNMLVLRGEQVMRTVLRQHVPELLLES